MSDEKPEKKWDAKDVLDHVAKLPRGSTVALEDVRLLVEDIDDKARKLAQAHQGLDGMARELAELRGRLANQDAHENGRRLKAKREDLDRQREQGIGATSGRAVEGS